MRSTRRPRKPKLNLAVRGIDGHVVTTTDGDWVWYLLPTQRWAFLPRDVRKSQVRAFTRRLAELAGYDAHLRVTSRPYQTMDWVHRLDEATPDPLGGKYKDSPWARHVLAMAHRIEDLLISEKVVYFGVKLRSRRSAAKVVGAAAKIGVAVPDGALMTREQEIEDLDKIMASEGLHGRPATTQDVEWLFRRSLGVGLSSPEVTPTSVPWTEDDLVDIADEVDSACSPFGGLVHLTRRDGEQGYVAGLVLGRAEWTDIADPRFPWLTLGEQYGAEVSVHFKIQDTKEAAGKIERRIKSVRAQEEHYAEIKVKPPMSLHRRGQRASEIEDEIAYGDEVEATRFDGYVYFAVSAAVREDTAEGHKAARTKVTRKIRRITEAYARSRKTILHPHGPASGISQWQMLRSFCPGEPIPSTAHRQRGPALYVAAGNPLVSATLGDNRGFYLGNTVGAGSQPVFWDPFRAPQVEKSPFFTVTGDQGAGKSTIFVSALYNGVLRGDPWTCWDPPGTLARLCNLPELRGIAQNIDLRRGAPGLLNPYALIPEPRREDYDTREEFWAEQRLAKQKRRSLATDILLLQLPADLYRNGDARLAVSDAVMQAPATQWCHLGVPLDVLDKADEGHYKRIVRFLRQQAEAERADLLFKSLGDEWAEAADLSKLLLFVSAPGIVPPDALKDREDWTPSEQTAMPLLLAATYLTANRVRGLPREMRKGLLIDEGKQLARTPMGQELLVDLTSGVRKMNCALGVADQSPDAILGIGEIGHQVGTAFVGRTTHQPTAAANLPLLHLPQDSGYEAQIMTLSPPGPNGLPAAHEFVMRDADGNVGILQVDLGHIPQALAITNTTPDHGKVTRARAAREMAEVGV